MKNDSANHNELFDWIDALDNLVLFNGREDAKNLISQFISYAETKGLTEENIRSLLLKILFLIMRKSITQEIGI